MVGKLVEDEGKGGCSMTGDKNNFSKYFLGSLRQNGWCLFCDKVEWADVRKVGEKKKH
jgi:hypothetical protein